MTKDMPAKTKLLIQQLLEKVNNHPTHTLDALERLELYKTFGNAVLLETQNYNTIKLTRLSREELLDYRLERIKRFTLADKVLGWLAIITVSKVLPLWEKQEVWEKSEARKNEEIAPSQILEVAKQVLTGNIDLLLAFDMLEEFSDGLGIENWVTFDMTCLFNAAFWTLEMLLSGVNLNVPTFKEDESLIPNYDFASDALRAYIAQDENSPGLIGNYFGIDVDVANIPIIKDDQPFVTSQNEVIIPVKFDREKKKEFWNWWLTEAVPQAWQLVED